MWWGVECPHARLYICEGDLRNQLYPLALLARESGEGGESAPWRYRSIDLSLMVGGRTVEAQVLAADAPAALSDIVPLARSLATLMSRTVLDCTVSTGKDVPCRKGCSHCCKHFVPLAGPEAFRMSAELQALPEDRRQAVMGRFMANARRLIDAGPPDVPAGVHREDGATVSPAGACGHWYAQLHLTCPLADGDLCSLYEQRPIACREHMVTSDPALCEGFQPGRGRILPLPVSMLAALAELTAEFEQLPAEAVILSLAPAWTDLNEPRGRRTWPATQLVGALVGIARRLAAAHTDQSAA